MALRYVHQRSSDSELPDTADRSSRVEVDVPLVAPRCAGCPFVRAAVTAGSSPQTDAAVSSRVSGRVPLIGKAVLTGETHLGFAAADGQVLRALRLTTEVPVVPATRLQLSYAYRTGPQLPLGQVFEARILRRISLGW